jgi:hypothetical protein
MLAIFAIRLGTQYRHAERSSNSHCRMLFHGFVLFAVSTGLAAQHSVAEEPLKRDQVQECLLRAVQFFHDRVAVEGSYLWQYSADLSQQEGEGKASRNTGWVQPPGTPAVGLALLRAYRATGDSRCLTAACDAASALVRGQLQSGGWDYRIEFDPAQRTRYAYRLDGERPNARNTSTLDDNTTQAALKFLMEIDQELGFQNEQVHTTVRYALDSLLRVQYSNGAWPQRFDGQSADSRDVPVQAARYPDTWSRKYPRKDYRNYFTFNDNTIIDMISTMFQAARIYQESTYAAAAERAGDFILLAQMPEPQPAWAQQYNHDMEPAWARKFEPPSITGGESQSVMQGLLTLYRHTGKQKYLEPIPRAIRYLRASELEGGRLARFYELQSNQPLYFTKDYELTYSDEDMPTHYAFKVASRLDGIESAYRKLLEEPQPRLQESSRRMPVRITPKLVEQVAEIIASQDHRGAWVEGGSLRYQQGPPDGRIISCRTFIRNLDLLSTYLNGSGGNHE